MKTHSFSGRITRRIVLSMLLLMSVVSGLIFLVARSEITVLTGVHYQDVLENVNDKVEEMLDKVEVSTANNLAEIQEHLGSPEEVFDALEKELKLNPHIVGCGVGFNPDYFPEQGYKASLNFGLRNIDFTYQNESSQRLSSSADPSFPKMRWKRRLRALVVACCVR